MKGEKGMALINFQERFANDIENGKKRQTIRKQRKYPIKLGETLYLYTGLRTKKARKLRTEICKNVEGIRIQWLGIVLYNDKKRIKKINVGSRTSNKFAEEDGFKDFYQMMAWFDDTHGLPFDGVLIKW